MGDPVTGIGKTVYLSTGISTQDTPTPRNPFSHKPTPRPPPRTKLYHRSSSSKKQHFVKKKESMDLTFGSDDSDSDQPAAEPKMSRAVKKRLRNNRQIFITRGPGPSGVRQPRKLTLLQIWRLNKKVVWTKLEEMKAKLKEKKEKANMEEKKRLEEQVGSLERKLKILQHKLKMLQQETQALKNKNKNKK